MPSLLFLVCWVALVFWVALVNHPVPNAAEKSTYAVTIVVPSR
ncbi:MAG TPA: hypothetical protein VLJ59_01070 [Mycobacteriales bacterium]|nr:hypothetical protein [Mycobacteriales bacterium]